MKLYIIHLGDLSTKDKERSLEKDPPEIMSQDQFTSEGNSTKNPFIFMLCPTIHNEKI